MKLHIDEMSLQEIEQALRIKNIQHAHTSNNTQVELFDVWSEVENFIVDNKKRNSHYRHFAVTGYELAEDNHYIKLHYTIEYYNT